MGEFISFVRIKETEPKKSRPMGRSSAALRASVWTGGVQSSGWFPILM